MDILAIGAVIGGVIGIAAYLPQIAHLIKVKDSTGNSLIAWYCWLVGNLLLWIYAVAIRNISYEIVESLYLLANLVMIALIYQYGKPKKG